MIEQLSLSDSDSRWIWHRKVRHGFVSPNQISCVFWNIENHNPSVTLTRKTTGKLICSLIFYFLKFEVFFVFLFCQMLRFLVSKPCFLNFSTQSHAESFGNYLKKQVLDPKRPKLNQNSDFGDSCPDLPRPVQEGRSLSAKRIFLFFFKTKPFRIKKKTYLCILNKILSII